MVVVVVVVAVAVAVAVAGSGSCVAGAFAGVRGPRCYIVV